MSWVWLELGTQVRKPSSTISPTSNCMWWIPLISTEDFNTRQEHDRNPRLLLVIFDIPKRAHVMSLPAFLAIQAPTANFLLCNNCLLYDSKSDWALDYASPIPTYIKLPIVQQPLLYVPKFSCAWQPAPCHSNSLKHVYEHNIDHLQSGWDSP